MFSLLRAFHVVTKAPKLSYIGSEGVDGGQGPMHRIHNFNVLLIFNLAWFFSAERF